MNDTTITIVVCIAIFIGLPVLILRIMDHVSNSIALRRYTPEKLAALRKAFEERLAHPDWTYYEMHLGRPAPRALRELFADRKLITSTGLDFADDECEFSITSFNPLDEQGLLETRPWLGFDAIAFASSEGDPIYLRPGPAEPDCVYITFHDGGDTEVHAESVEAFVAKIRAGKPIE